MVGQSGARAQRCNGDRGSQMGAFLLHEAIRSGALRPIWGGQASMEQGRRAAKVPQVPLSLSPRPRNQLLQSPPVPTVTWRSMTPLPLLSYILNICLPYVGEGPGVRKHVGRTTGARMRPALPWCPGSPWPRRCARLSRS